MSKTKSLGEPTRFKCKPSVITAGMTGAAAGLFSPGDLAVEELGEINWGELHAYMVRRFGPPNIGCDPYKEIARWIITTPMEGLHLSVTIAPHSTHLLFGYIMQRDLGERLYQADGVIREAKRDRFVAWCHATHGRLAPSWELHESGVETTYEERAAAQAITSKWYDEFDKQDVEPEREPNEYDRAVNALRRALRDLTRCVGVRDQDISVHGVVDGGGPSAKVVDTAGRAPPAIAYDEAMWEIYAAIHRLGGGTAGLKRLTEIITAGMPESGQD